MKKEIVLVDNNEIEIVLESYNSMADFLECETALTDAETNTETLQDFKRMSHYLGSSLAGALVALGGYYAPLAAKSLEDNFNAFVFESFYDGDRFIKAGSAYYLLTI